MVGARGFREWLAGITHRLRLYDLRHFYATAMLQDGADLKAVSQLMGHSSTQMTSEVYYHLLEGQKRDALEKLPIPSVFSSLSVAES